MSDFLRSYLTVGDLRRRRGGSWSAACSASAACSGPTRPQPEKYLNYESGVDPVGTGWSQSQIRYYIFALLFVMFDVEAVFIFPWAIRLEAYGVFGLVEMVDLHRHPRPRPALRLAQGGAAMGLSRADGSRRERQAPQAAHLAAEH